MSESAFFHKLALERCQHYLAQLAAAVAMSSRLSDGEQDSFTDTFVLLVDSMNRDIAFLSEVLAADIGEEPPQDGPGETMPRTVHGSL